MPRFFLQIIALELLQGLWLLHPASKDYVSPIGILDTLVKLIEEVYFCCGEKLRK